MKYREIEINDCDQIVDLHLLTFKSFFLSSLGSSFLRTYYSSCIKSSNSVGVCAVNEDNKIVGFAVGNLMANKFHITLIKQNKMPFFIEGFKLLFTRPFAVVRLIKNLMKGSSTVQDSGLYGELLSIGVNPSEKGKGIGKILILEFENILKSNNCKQVALTTDYLDNDYALSFYSKLGYDVYYDFITYPNRRMFKLIKSI